MELLFKVQAQKQLRVIIDTDADCEADDPFAIAHALMSPKLNVKAIFAEHFGGGDSVQRSYDEIKTVLASMSLDTAVFLGAKMSLTEEMPEELSPASAYLIEEALREDESALFVLCLGALTNIASAIVSRPEIASRFTIVTIGGHSYDKKAPSFREFNFGNDTKAANIVLSSGAEIWQVPIDVYSKMRISLAELQKKVYPRGEIGRHLFEKMINYNASPNAGWTAGESWSLGDSPAVGLAIDEGCGSYTLREAPVVNEDTSYSFESGRNMIRVYHHVDSRFVLEDFLSKLELLYG